MIKQNIKLRFEELKKANAILEEEIVVCSMILESSHSLTQRDIARSAPWLGCHPKHERDVSGNEFETTTRKVRHVVRNLRIKHKIPILSSTSGYFVPDTNEEVSEYLDRMERESKSRAEASIETYRVMAETLNIKSEYFEGLAKIPIQTELAVA